MSGPRDLRRGTKPFERPADAAEIINGKSYFTYRPWGRGFALSVHRRGLPVETIPLDTEAALNRRRRELSD
ncbi:MAG: hypothetical protein EOS32_21070, partial [Mesorhizobium sp.]|uniref:hypothetical protein n=1 Tax=Mesorhizobium sp. TaxID=1871066 RepID=UPI000FE50C43